MSARAATAARVAGVGADLLEVEELSVRFRTPYGLVQALSGAGLCVRGGEFLVVIGESGCGKTVLAQAVMRLLPLNAEVSGAVRLGGLDLLHLPPRELREQRRRRIAYIPQSPASALNPVRRIGSLLLELAKARGVEPARARAEVSAALAALDLDFDQIAPRYAHQLSGGMQQRVVNSLALVGRPDLVIADEPTSGLDSDLVDSTAEQLRSIAERGSGVLVITHDLALAARLGGRIALLYASYVVETRPTAAFFEQPEHPYGVGLLGALPERGGVPIPGLPPELTDLPPGCAFAERCGHRRPVCVQAVPDLFTLADDGGAARCVLHAPG